jgi:hypothetical protein
MTKGDLLDLLAPFSDEIEVLVRNVRGTHFDLTNGLYGIRRDGEGCISLQVAEPTDSPRFGHTLAVQPTAE